MYNSHKAVTKQAVNFATKTQSNDHFISKIELLTIVQQQLTSYHQSLSICTIETLIAYR